jgi:hypothetical protein
MRLKRLFGILPVFTVLAVAAALLASGVAANAQAPQINGLETQFPNNVYSTHLYNNEYWNIYGSNLGTGGYSGTAVVNVTWQTTYLSGGFSQSMSHVSSYGAGSSQYWWDSPTQLNFFANGTFDLPAGVPTSNIQGFTANVQVCNFGPCSLPVLNSVCTQVTTC